MTDAPAALDETKGPRHQPHLRIMFDSANAAALIAAGKAHPEAMLACYVQGDPFPNLEQIRAALGPHRDVLTIALHPSIDADCLDMEKGGASIFDFPDWAKRQKKRIERPVGYTFLSQLQPFIDNAAKAGLRFDDHYRGWSAHPNGVQHRCSPACGWGLKEHLHGTQYLWQPSLDWSLVGSNFADH